MDLFLVRHLESEKNVNDCFSSLENNERLTEKGNLNAHKLALEFTDFVTECNLKIKNIYVANSMRAVESCELFAENIHADIKSFDALTSAKTKMLSGVSEEKAKRIYGKYMQQYELYRKGLFNVYNFDNLVEREDKRKYEKQVMCCLKKILFVPDESSKFLFLHRSAMTAILIYFARKFYDYPSDFYGYVPINLGHVYWLRKCNNNWEFKTLNCPYWTLKEKYVDEIM